MEDRLLVKEKEDTIMNNFYDAVGKEKVSYLRDELKKLISNRGREKFNLDDNEKALASYLCDVIDSTEREIKESEWGYYRESCVTLSYEEISRATGITDVRIIELARMKLQLICSTIWYVSEEEIIDRCELWLRPYLDYLRENDFDEDKCRAERYFMEMVFYESENGADKE